MSMVAGYLYCQLDEYAQNMMHGLGFAINI
jgi:hypothetical protein